LSINADRDNLSLSVIAVLQILSACAAGTRAAGSTQPSVYAVGTGAARLADDDLLAGVAPVASVSSIASVHASPHAVAHAHAHQAQPQEHHDKIQ
jgi:hypothetical protein